ncbi:hypothetical protein CSA56_09935 [candidate division KSB3 bacterium]|uniref:Uncharacterized protein n=1 Tax=candidate division KSB3 bacterium TaxID=2044937 RepID=A0A2G6KFS7_9BACT|nr:MAG: hypothetical protein CSA56_09935 [candidate division KSB3 bacterium]
MLGMIGEQRRRVSIIDMRVVSVNILFTKALITMSMRYDANKDVDKYRGGKTLWKKWILIGEI